MATGHTVRVYVQMHNRGVLPADGVRVIVVLTDRLAAPPAPVAPVPQLPANFDGTARGNHPTPVAGVAAGVTWHTLTIASVDDLRVGFPEVVSADIPGASLNNAGVYALVVLLNHPQDQFTNNTQQIHNLVTAESKAA